jgi:hypothetical protein
MRATFSNFRMTKIVGKTILSEIKYAQVDLTIKRIFRKPETRTVDIFKKGTSAFWAFLDTGDFTPGHEVEHLALSAEAKFHRDLPEGRS